MSRPTARAARRRPARPSPSVPPSPLGLRRGKHGAPPPGPRTTLELHAAHPFHPAYGQPATPYTPFTSHPRTARPQPLVCRTAPVRAARAPVAEGLRRTASASPHPFGGRTTLSGTPRRRPRPRSRSQLLSPSPAPQTTGTAGTDGVTPGTAALPPWVHRHHSTVSPPHVGQSFASPRTPHRGLRSSRLLLLAPPPSPPPAHPARHRHHGAHSHGGSAGAGRRHGFTDGSHSTSPLASAPCSLHLLALHLARRHRRGQRFTSTAFPPPPAQRSSRPSHHAPASPQRPDPARPPTIQPTTPTITRPTRSAPLSARPSRPTGPRLDRPPMSPPAQRAPAAPPSR